MSSKLHIVVIGLVASSLVAVGCSSETGSEEESSEAAVAVDTRSPLVPGLYDGDEAVLMIARSGDETWVQITGAAQFAGKVTVEPGTGRLVSRGRGTDIELVSKGNGIQIRGDVRLEVERRANGAIDGSYDSETTKLTVTDSRFDAADGVRFTVETETDTYEGHATAKSGQMALEGMLGKCAVALQPYREGGKYHLFLSASGQGELHPQCAEIGLYEKFTRPFKASTTR